MLKRHLLIFFCFLALQGAATDPGASIIDLGTGLKGTPAQICATLNKPLEDAWKRVDEFQRELDEENKAVADRKAIVIQTARATAQYKAIEQTMDTAKAELAAAREAQNNGKALDAGSRYNLARGRMQKIETDAVRADEIITRHQKNADDYSHRLDGAKTALKKTAEWRSRLVQAIRTTFLPEWPIARDAEFYVAQSTVREVDAQTLTVEVEAVERVGVEKKNAGGDGISHASYIPHNIRLVMSRSDDVKASVGEDLRLNRVFKVVRKSNGGSLCTVEPNDESTLGLLLRGIDRIAVVPETYLDTIDGEVSAKIKKELEATEK